jgi:hypothetical protein
MIDVPRLRIGRDDEGRDPDAVAVLVDRRRGHVVVEPAPVVPVDEDGGGVPVRALHGRVDDRGDVGLPLVDAGRRVLAVRARGGDPAHRRQRPRPGCGEVGGKVPDVGQLVIVLDIGEEGQGVPDAGGGRLLGHCAAGLGAGVVAVGLCPLLHVVRPGDVVLVEQIGHVGPREGDGTGARTQRRGVGLRRLLRGVGAVQRPLAAAGRAVGAPGRPARDHVEVGDVGPRRRRLEHVVVEHEVLGVGPVVRDLGPRVVAHHVRRALVDTGRVGGAGAGVASGVPLLDEPVHLASCDVGLGVDVAVGAAPVDVGGVVVGALTGAGRVGHAHRRDPVQHRDAVRPGIGAEVTVERTVLLHHHDDVPDLVDALGDHVGARRAPLDHLWIVGRRAGGRRWGGRRRLRRCAPGQPGDQHGHHDDRPDAAGRIWARIGPVHRADATEAMGDNQ